VKNLTHIQLSKNTLVDHLGLQFLSQAKNLEKVLTLEFLENKLNKSAIQHICSKLNLKSLQILKLFSHDQKTSKGDASVRELNIIEQIKIW